MLEPRLFVVGFEPPAVVVEPLEVVVGKQLVVVVAHNLVVQVVQVVLVVLAVEPQQFVVAQLVLPQQGLLQPPGLFLELPLEKLTIT